MKSERQNKIIELIRKNDIGTQEELAKELNRAGYTVTQATVSRDIRELKLTKASINGKHQKYVLYGAKEEDFNERYEKVLKEGFVSMAVACNILVIKTVSGMAMAVCAAIDTINFEEEIGSIAGDDTIMLATSGKEDATLLMEKINGLLKK